MYPGNTIFLAENLSLDDSVFPLHVSPHYTFSSGHQLNCQSTVPRSFGLFLLSSSMIEMTTRI